MIARLLDAVFGCWHTNLSFPLTTKSNKRRIAAASLTGTYVVCLDCGKEFPYDWHEMKLILGDREHAAPVPNLAPKQAS